MVSLGARCVPGYHALPACSGSFLRLWAPASWSTDGKALVFISGLKSAPPSSENCGESSKRPPGSFRPFRIFWRLGRKILCAFVYGSVARAREHATSDIDLMVIGQVGLRN